jgi:hypothetical protein
VSLCGFGFVLLAIGLSIYLTGVERGTGIALLTLGSITFIPGFYHTRIAYYAWKGYEGYSLDDIPDM